MITRAYRSSSELYSVDPSTGAGTLIGSPGFGWVESLDFRADGTLFGVSKDTGDLLTIDLTTGAGAYEQQTAIRRTGKEVVKGLTILGERDVYFLDFPGKGDY